MHPEAFNPCVVTSGTDPNYSTTKKDRDDPVRQSTFKPGANKRSVHLVLVKILGTYSVHQQ